MTTEASDLGRIAATPSRRFGRTLSFLLATALAGAAMPVLAATGLAGDSADQSPLNRSVSQSLAQPLPVALGRELLFAADVNQLIAAGVGDVPASAGGRQQTLLQRGLALLGTPYRWGGTSPDGGFDCSGLVSYVFRTALGIELPRVSREMATTGEQIERAQLDAGDLVFFARRGRRVDHVGIYLGNGRFLHAPRSGRDVTVSSLDSGYWSRKFTLARRVTGV